MEETQDTAIDETEVQTEETQPETERKKRTKKETEESESETQETETEETEPETEPEAQEAAQTNEELIEQQEIESLPKVEENFRFSQIEKTYAVAKRNKTLIREEMDRSSRPVGRVNKRGLPLCHPGGRQRMALCGIRRGAGVCEGEGADSWEEGQEAGSQI